MSHKEERKFSCICCGYLTCYEEGVGSTAYWQHKGAHALLGCAVGAAKSGDCASGAFGGVIGEIVAEELANTSLANNLLSPDAKKQANAKKTISTISQITSLFSASEAGLDFKTAQQTAKNAAENNALDLKHLHSIQSLKVLVALNTQLVDQGKDNNSFVIRDSGGVSFTIGNKSYSLGNGGLIVSSEGNLRKPSSHHNVNRKNGFAIGVDLSINSTIGVTGNDIREILQDIKIIEIIGGYGDNHLHLGSPNLSKQAQKIVDKLKNNNPYLQEGSENNKQYQIFNDNGVGYFTNNENGWDIKTRQNFNSEKQIGKFFNNPTNRSKDKASSNIDAIKDHLEWQRIHFQNPANAYKPELNK